MERNKVLLYYFVLLSLALASVVVAINYFSVSSKIVVKGFSKDIKVEIDIPKYTELSNSGTGIYIISNYKINQISENYIVVSNLYTNPNYSINLYFLKLNITKNSEDISKVKIYSKLVNRNIVNNNTNLGINATILYLYVNNNCTNTIRDFLCDVYGVCPNNSKLKYKNQELCIIDKKFCKHYLEDCIEDVSLNLSKIRELFIGLVLPPTKDDKLLVFQVNIAG